MNWSVTSKWKLSHNQSGVHSVMASDAIFALLLKMWRSTTIFGLDSSE